MAITIVCAKSNLKKYLKLSNLCVQTEPRENRSAMKLKELAARLGIEFRGDGETEILMPAPIEAAGPGTVIFVANEKYAPLLATTSAS
jgi:hypothetical protein